MQKMKNVILVTAFLTSSYAHAQFGAGSPPMPLWATQLATFANLASPSDWVRPAMQGIQLRHAGNLEEAASTFKTALGQMRGQEANSDPRLIQYGPIRLDMLIAYGDVLNRLNRPDEALPVLQQAAAIEQDELEKREQRATPSMSYLDAMSALQATMSNAMNMARQMNRRFMVVESDADIPYEESLAEQLPDVLVTSLLLADSYSRLGDRKAVLSLFDTKFQSYLQRQSENTNPSARFNLDLTVEAACLRFSLILARVGPSAQQEQAFKCALDLNLANQRFVGTGATVSTIQAAVASQRRLFVGAYADQAIRNSPLDVLIQRRLIELIADSKGLATRYTQRIRQLLFHSKNPALVKLRTRFNELEDTRRQLPIEGSQAVVALVEWENARSAVMREALPHLNQEGLGDLFLDGATLLKLAQQKLKNEVLIGFSIYRPIDLTTMAPLAGRVLRYSVTEATVDIQDIGTQKEIESLVYRWRSAVAQGQDTTAVPLSHRLLGGLPDAVKAEKRWVIDPDGAISLVPFEALREAKGNLVIEGHSVSYVTSIASFANKPANSVTTPATALIIANPQFANNMTVSGGSSIARSVPTAAGTLLGHQNFTPLPHTAGEAAKVQEALMRIGVDSDMRLGSRATLDALNFKSAPRYLHIATHGIYMAPGTDPNSREFVRIATSIPGMQSALVFTPNGNGSIFTGADFARLPLAGTEMVVLSACDTGNGALNVGEAVESLRMAVEEAGAKSSVTSLWPVPSEATAQLMGTFYNQLGQGVTKVEALRYAKLELMKTHPAPDNWAGFLLSGER
jgi:CHAT domain-containing protein